MKTINGQPVTNLQTAEDGTLKCFMEYGKNIRPDTQCQYRNILQSTAGEQIDESDDIIALRNPCKYLIVDTEQRQMHAKPEYGNHCESKYGMLHMIFVFCRFFLIQSSPLLSFTKCSSHKAFT